MRSDRGTLAPLACAALLATTTLLPGSPAGAQLPAPAPLETVFGGGLHAYFAGDYDRAFRDLNDVIAAATSPATIDPRWYYFRGLAALKLGRFDAAEADFTAGAEREAAGLGNWPVSRSLERVQGTERLELERHRARARVAMLRRATENQRRRRVAIEEAQPDMQRGRRPLPEPGDDEANPFGSDEPLPEAEPLPTPEAEPAADPGADAPAEPGPAAEATEQDELPLAPQRDGDDSFGESGAAAGDPPMSEDRAAQQDQQVEELAAEAEAATDQVDQRTEQEAVAAEDAAAQKDGQMEAEAAAE